MRTKLLGMTLQELEQAAVGCGLKPFVGRQLADWLYSKKVRDWDGMRNLSKQAKAVLSERFDLGTARPEGVAVSVDGTKKYLFAAGCGKVGADGSPSQFIEAVMIPEEDRRTLCVSSQAGCKMGCAFCMTGRQGWHGNLDAASILNQFVSVDEAAELTNAVFMGMGEPLDNPDEVFRAIEVLTAPWGFGWSPKRITLSTIGVLPNLRRFLDGCRCHLAVSLHNPFPEERAEMMRAEKPYPLEDIIRLIREYDFSGQRRVSFEYTMFSGWNDDKIHADALSRLLRGLECRVNLIRFHKIPDFGFNTSPDVVIEAFKERLNNNGTICTIRTSRGEDILAACGMLAGKHLS